MTDKEQIIIDSVDVSKCKHFPLLMYKDHPKWTVCHEWGSGECRKRPDCYFKQLARKTQECEELKERVTIAEDNLACEIQARLYHQNEWLKFSKEVDRCCKALEEIEIFFDNFCDICPNADDDSFDYCNDGCLLDNIAQPILKIISEAKGKNNDKSR